MSRPVQLLVAAAVGAVIAIGAFAVGVTVTREPSPSSTPTPPPAEPVAEIAAKLVPSTVSIEAGEAQGSGVIYDAEGLILTAAHVVGDRDEIVVRLAAGDRVDGEVLGRDDRRDIALVRIEHDDLIVAELGTDVEVEVGQLAVAVGSPFGLEDSVTSGVVSAVGRILPNTQNIAEVIQTDAAINPGNSGGALADREGRVIGINVSTRNGGEGGIGFAVPIGIALEVAERIQAGEEPAPAAFLGVSGTDPTEGPGGALLVTVEPGTPAADAGLQPDDLIQAVDGEDIPSMDALTRAIRAHDPGETVTLTVLRDDETLEIDVELIEA